MYHLNNNNINIADIGEANHIVLLLNKAYRGEESKKGWTTEADLIQGDIRTSLAQVENVIKKENSYFLIYKLNHQIEGCVNLQMQNNRLYLGMFAVNPNVQNAGIGKQLLQAAELLAHQLHCTHIFMVVVSVRNELINWYKRHGYIDTQKVIPFNEDGISGTHNQPLYFIELEKEIK
jgi:N-acetylglutamate synthase-like GNAT family acetyltransferase